MPFVFPQKQKDLETDCSCPDWSNPCKHIAAVFYLMAEAFDKDPFLLFKLRGMEREEFLNALQEGGATGDATGEIIDAKSKIDPEPLPLDRNRFWEQNSALAVPVSGVSPIRLNAALPKRLGSLAFWRSDKDFIDEMERIYKNASGYAESCIISSSDSHN